jgi:multiple sugar transport system substrate-binding protein
MTRAFAKLTRRGVAAGFVAAVALSVAAPAAQAQEVRWSQWKTTEVGDKFMQEVKAAFEKANPGIKLTLIDSPFQGFRDRTLVQHQAKRLPDVMMVQVDWVAEFADLG